MGCLHCLLSLPASQARGGGFEPWGGLRRSALGWKGLTACSPRALCLLLLSAPTLPWVPLLRIPLRGSDLPEGPAAGCGRSRSLLPRSRLRGGRCSVPCSSACSAASAAPHSFPGIGFNSAHGVLR